MPPQIDNGPGWQTDDDCRPFCDSPGHCGCLPDEDEREFGEPPEKYCCRPNTGGLQGVALYPQSLTQELNLGVGESFEVEWAGYFSQPQEDLKACNIDVEFIFPDIVEIDPASIDNVFPPTDVTVSKYKATWTEVEQSVQGFTKDDCLPFPEGWLNIVKNVTAVKPGTNKNIVAKLTWEGEDGKMHQRGYLLSTVTVTE